MIPILSGLVIALVKGMVHVHVINFTGHLVLGISPPVRSISINYIFDIIDVQTIKIVQAVNIAVIEDL